MPRSRTFKIVHTFYLLVIAVLVTLLFVERQKQPDEPGTSALSEQLEDTQQTLTRRISNLSEQMDSRFAALEARMPEPQTLDEPVNSDQPQETQAPREQRATEPEDTTSYGSDETAHADNTMTDNFDAHYREFEAQPVDPEWAYPSVELIRTHFAEHDYLQDFDLADIECRSSICQVDIEVAESGSMNPTRLLQALDGMNDNDQGFEYELAGRSLDDVYRVLLIHTNQARN